VRDRLSPKVASKSLVYSHARKTDHGRVGSYRMQVKNPWATTTSRCRMYQGASDGGEARWW